MTSSSIHVRVYQPADLTFVRQLLQNSFDTDMEQRLTDAIRNSDDSLVELVAEWKGKPVGHILFTDTSGLEPMRVAGLGPMAVSEGYRSRGIGSALIHIGCNICAKMGYHAVVVLGHPGYYPKFGFSPAADSGIKSEYDVPVEVFMLKWLDRPENFSGGLVRYHPFFNEVPE